jgi:hypothetical protein
VQNLQEIYHPSERFEYLAFVVVAVAVVEADTLEKLMVNYLS